MKRSRKTEKNYGQTTMWQLPGGGGLGRLIVMERIFTCVVNTEYR